MKHRSLSLFIAAFLFCMTGQIAYGTTPVHVISVNESTSDPYVSQLAKDMADGVATLFTQEQKTVDTDYHFTEKIIPVLMFHHISEKEGAPLNSQAFRRYMTELSLAGYQTIFYDELYDFVKTGAPLPEKPVIITFDDGYLSNYTYAYPILKGLGMKGEIAAIGVSMGRDTMEETGVPITPHFSWDQAREMVASGVIRIHSHSYDMHKHASVQDVDRLGVIQNPEESEEIYTDLFLDDTKKMKALISTELGYEDLLYTYPYGKYNRQTDSILTRAGYLMTITTKPGVNKIKIGELEKLRLMKRIPCDDNHIDSIVEKIKSY